MKKNAVLANIQVNLKRYMKEKELTIKELGEKSGVSEPTIKRLRTDSSVSANTSIDVLNSLASALNITIMDLIDNKNKQSSALQYQEKNEDTDDEYFTYVFKQDVLDFKQNDKAIFKPYKAEDNLTKYFFDNSFDLYQLIQQKDYEIIAKNKYGEICTLNYEDVMAIISKQIYGE